MRHLYPIERRPLATRDEKYTRLNRPVGAARALGLSVDVQTVLVLAIVVALVVIVVIVVKRLLVLVEILLKGRVAYNHAATQRLKNRTEVSSDPVRGHLGHNQCQDRQDDDKG
jgi:hypothetical protein